MHCCRTTVLKNDLPHVYIEGRSFFIVIKPTPAKFVERMEWRLILLLKDFLFSYLLQNVKPQAARRIAGLPKDDVPNPICATFTLLLFIIQPTPTKFGVNIVR